jgi:hypothetical protein
MDRAGRPTARARRLREVLGLIGPHREAAVDWLVGLSMARQEEELAVAGQRDRTALAEMALAPLGRLLDALGAGAALPG